MLHPVAELAGNFLGDVDRVLGNEIDPHALRPDQAHDLLDLVLQGLGRIVEQQMGLVEEEHQLRFLRIAHFRQAFEQFGQQPQQEGGIKLWAAHQLVGGEHIDVAAPLIVHLQEIVDLQRRLAEEPVCPLRLETQQLALDRAHGRLGDIAVFSRQLRRILLRPGQHGLQVGKVEQQQTVVIGMAEHDLQHAFLGLVEIEQAGEQQRAHFRNRGADRVALLAIEVPEHHRVVGIAVIGDSQFLRAFFQAGGMLELGRSRHGDTRQVALHVGDEYRHAFGREAFGEALQGHRLAGAGRTRDQAVAVGPAKVEILLLAIGGEAEIDLSH